MNPQLANLTGSVVALVTPFSRGSLDRVALARLTERQVQNGSAGIVVCGSTGEAATLTAEEASAAIETVVQVVRRRVPVIAGCTASATEKSVDAAVAAALAGADALLCAPPPYVKPTQDGIVAHIRAVAHAANLPVMLYDVPARTGVGATDATIAALFGADLIFALKDATADLARPPRLRRLCGPRLLQFSGDDATSGAYRAAGGAGCVSVTANVVPALCAGLHRAWETRDLTGVVSRQVILAPLHEAMFLESNPIPVKAALAQLGLCEAAVRLPLTRAVAQTDEALGRLLAGVMAEEARETEPLGLPLAG